MAGDGLQIFYGDCRGGDGRCVPATESSFGFAVSIAVDQQNNVYFSDQGNNRIRAWAAVQMLPLPLQHGGILLVTDTT